MKNFYSSTNKIFGKWVLGYKRPISDMNVFSFSSFIVGVISLFAMVVNGYVDGYPKLFIAIHDYWIGVSRSFLSLS